MCPSSAGGVGFALVRHSRVRVGTVLESRGRYHSFAQSPVLEELVVVVVVVGELVPVGWAHNCSMGQMIEV